MNLPESPLGPPPLSPEEQARAKFLSDSRALMADARFRRWLWHLLEGDGWCEVHAVESASADGPALHKALGKRALGLALIHVVMAEAPEQYMQMLNEARSMKVLRETRAAMEKRG